MKPFRLHFVGVGPQRTGTSWLHQVLLHHPALCMPKGVKETLFFDRYYEKGLSWYATHFAHRVPNQLCGEIAPTYFDVAVAPARIHKCNPACQIIINLRNPVDRAFSSYRHHLMKGRVSGSFAEACIQVPRILDAGRYTKHILRWLDTFGADRVTFVLLEDIASHPETVLNDLYDFLGVETISMPVEGHTKIGSAVTIPRYPRLARIAAQGVTILHTHGLHKLVRLGKALGLRKIYAGSEKRTIKLAVSEQIQLLKMYEADITFVETLLNRDLSVWRRTAYVYGQHKSAA